MLSFVDRRSALATGFAGALVFLLGSSAHASYADELVARALDARLHERAEWRTLLHYQDGWFGDGSLVDDPSFFASPDGKEDPAAELEATIRSFFDPVPDEGKHPVCRFAARFEWLRDELGMEAERLPVPRCEPIEELIEHIQPQSVTLSFPTAYMNSPASMYGHTLLLIDSVYDSELLSYAVNYAGQVDTAFGPLYAVKGIFGFYRGYFAILPYYAKLQEYSDVNDRDIWEYRLNLTPQEIRRLILHVYELEEIWSDYYFFDENCSFNLLYLLDVARPGLGLAEDPGFWVIPLDTIRQVRDAGLVAEVEYRPSKSTKIEHLAAQLDDREQEIAIAIARGQAEPAAAVDESRSPRRRVLVADLATEYLQYLYFDRSIPQEEYAPRFRALLAVRSQLGGIDVELPPIEAPARPDPGHRSSRIGVGGGVFDDEAFTRLTYRAVYHDLIDNRGGYLEGSQIIFAEVDVRYTPDDGDVWLEHLNLVDIVSISPRSRFFAPTSWKAQTGWLRRWTDGAERALVYDFTYGVGRSYRLPVSGLWYVFGETDVQLGGALDGNASWGFGGSTGWLLTTGRLQTHVFARDLRFVFGDETASFRAGAAQNLELAPNWGLRGEVTRAGEEGRWWWDASLRLTSFF